MTTPATPAQAASSTASAADTTATPQETIEHLQGTGIALFDWMRFHIIDLTITVSVGVAIYLLLTWLRRMARRKAEKLADQQGVVANALRVVATTKHLYLMLLSAWLVIGYSAAPPVIIRLLSVLFIAISAFQVAIWVREIIMGMIRSRVAAGNNEALGSATTIISAMVSMALFAIATVVMLDNIGVNVTGLVAGLGIGGIAIGMAAKGIFEDLFASLGIIFDKPFRRGQTIGFDGKTVTVEKIGLSTTRLRAATGEEVIVNNKVLINKELSNFSHLRRRRVTFAVGVTYETPLTKLRAIPGIISAMIEEKGHKLVRCGMIGYGASSIDYEVQFDVMSGDYLVMFNARHEMGLDILERFAEEGIGFAYPTQVSYTAAPDGSLVLPYEDHSEAPAAPAPAPAPAPAKPSAPSKSKPKPAQ
jgi:small-conductance mechanosensitive channel